MILIVIAMLTVAADELQIGDAAKIVADDSEIVFEGAVVRADVLFFAWLILPVLRSQRVLCLAPSRASSKRNAIRRRGSTGDQPVRQSSKRRHRRRFDRHRHRQHERITGLNVVPLWGCRSSAALRETPRPPPTTNTLLDVVEPSIETFTLTASLQGADAESPGWQDRFIGHEVAVERRLLEGLSSGLVRAGVLPALSAKEDRNRLIRTPTTSNEAFVAYAEGRALLDQRTTPNAIFDAAALFERAIANDQGFALASRTL